MRNAAPPQPSKAELERAEAQTMADIKATATAAIVLYFCMGLCMRFSMPKANSC